MMHRLSMIAVVVLLLGAPHLSRRARAEPPSCFPERTVLWAVPLVDSEGRTFGGIRAGQTVRVLEDFVCADGNEAQIEVNEPIHVRAKVPRKVLLAFARQELAQNGGFVRWAAGAPVVLGKPENGVPRLFLQIPITVRRSRRLHSRHAQPSKECQPLSPIGMPAMEQGPQPTPLPTGSEGCFGRRRRS